MARFGVITPETVGRAPLAPIDVPYTAGRHAIITRIQIGDWPEDAGFAASAAILHNPGARKHTKGLS